MRWRVTRRVCRKRPNEKEKATSQLSLRRPRDPGNPASLIGCMPARPRIALDASIAVLSMSGQTMNWVARGKLPAWHRCNAMYHG